MSPFDLHETLGDTVKTLAVRAHGKGLELACRLDRMFRRTSWAIRLGCNQVIVNLVGNAIKFTEQGEVVFEVEANRQTDREAVLQFAVTDTGIGIPPTGWRRSSGFRAGRQLVAAPFRRHGPGPDDLVAAGPEDGRPARRPSEVGRRTRYALQRRLELPVRRSSSARRPTVAASAARASVCWSSTTTPRTAASWTNRLRSWGMNRGMAIAPLRPCKDCWRVLPQEAETFSPAASG